MELAMDRLLTLRLGLAVLGLAACACSGSPESPGSGSATHASTKSSTSHATSSGSSGGGSSSGGSGSACNPATKLPTPPEGLSSLFCPFSAPRNGTDQDCNPAFDHCCETGPDAGLSTCTAVGTSCSASAVMDWGCADPDVDCPSGNNCCAPGATLVVGAPGCASSATGMTTTSCQSAACSGIQLCTKTSECPSGKSCVPFAQAGNDVGGCN
jgi:hypothetical protein